jgi:hypothetical protein
MVSVLSAQAIAQQEEDECTGYGRMGTMLGQVDQQCKSYKLTDEGRAAMIRMASLIAPLGGEKCAAKGKVAMLQDLSESFPRLKKAAETSNVKLFSRELCDSIALWLTAVARGKLVQRR